MLSETVAGAPGWVGHLRGPEASADAERARHSESTRDLLGVALRGIGDQDGIGERRRFQPLPHPACGEKLCVVQIPRTKHQQIHIPLQHDVLKPIVEHVHRAAEARLGQPAGKITVCRDHHRGPGNRPSEHQRLIACAPEVGTETLGVTHDHDTILRCLPIVAPAENGGPFTHRQQHMGDVRGDGRLAAASNHQAADADDWTSEPAARVGMAGVPAATLPGDFSVEVAEQRQDSEAVKKIPRRPVSGQLSAFSKASGVH